MIKVTELRVGNWVYDRPLDEGGGGNGNMEIDALDLSQGLFDLSGILLTPEILEKCGFEIKRGFMKDYDEDGYMLDGFIKYTDKAGLLNIGFKNNAYYAVIGTNADDETPYLKQISVPFNYLHQLQNLYFALTGEELPITL